MTYPGPLEKPDDFHASFLKVGGRFTCEMTWARGYGLYVREEGKTKQEALRLAVLRQQASYNQSKVRHQKREEGCKKKAQHKKRVIETLRQLKASGDLSIFEIECINWAADELDGKHEKSYVIVKGSDEYYKLIQEEEEERQREKQEFKRLQEEYQILPSKILNHYLGHVPS
jgi:hypothetical protein